MPAKKAAKAATKGKRYTAEEKAEILAYAAAQGRGGQSAAAKKFGVSPLTLSNWKKGAADGGSGVRNGRKAKEVGNGLVDPDTVLRELAKKGFKIVRLQNALTGEILEEKIDPKIEKLGLEFGAMPKKPNENAAYVSGAGGTLLVTLTLDRFLALTGTKP